MRAASCELCNWFLSIDCIDKKEICENFEPVDPAEEDKMDIKKCDKCGETYAREEEDEMLAIKCDKCGETYAREEDDRIGSTTIEMEVTTNSVLITSNKYYKYDFCPKCKANFFDWVNNTEVEEATDEEQAE